MWDLGNNNHHIILCISIKFLIFTSDPADIELLKQSKKERRKKKREEMDKRGAGKYT